jgi:hypothetical protein
MQFELEISRFDLTEILSELGDHILTIDVHLANNVCLEKCIVNFCDKDLEVMEVVCQGEKKKIDINFVERIEFQGFRRYKCQSSKIFVVN